MSDPDWLVICLCAEWCGVCREWRATFDTLARDRPGARYAWIDVEDEDEAMGDVDIETFPTLLVAHGGRARFYGPVQPSATQVGRLLDSLAARGAEAPEAAPEATALLQRLAPALLRKS